MSYNFMPVGLAMQGRKCLVVGGGAVAVRKIETLLQYDCAVTVIAPDLHAQVEAWGREGSIAIEQRAYKSPEAATFGLVIAATNDSALNRQVHDDAQGAGVMVNVVDVPDQCEFIFPAVIRRDCLSMAISTDGQAPFMSGHLRALLDNMFPQQWDRMMKMAAAYRVKVQQRWPDNVEKKRAAYDRFVQADWTVMLDEMNNADIEAEMDGWLPE